VLTAHVSLPRPRRRTGPLAWLRALWTLPTNILGHIAGFAASGGRRPRRIVGPAAHAWLYPIRRGLGLDWVGAVTLGHVVLHRADIFDGRLGRLVLAHELAHTRQHDWLGPLYLPLHILAQTASALLSWASGRPPCHSRVHDHNPLEMTFICLGAGAYRPLALGEPIANAPPGCDGDAMLAAFGL